MPRLVWRYFVGRRRSNRIALMELEAILLLKTSRVNRHRKNNPRNQRPTSDNAFRRAVT